jgi:transposase-like protein
MAQQERITILEFQNRFNTDEACREHLFKIRWPYGPVCPVCGGKAFYKIAKRNVYECKRCSHQISLTAGTIMHGSHTPLRKWFWAIYMASQDKRGVSAVRLQQELEVSYPAAWLMLHKIRKAMGDRDAWYQLSGIVEMDETYLGSSKRDGKRGRGTEKTVIQVGLSKDEQGYPEYIQMEVIENIQAETLRDFAVRTIKAGSTIYSDAYRSYHKAFSETSYDHRGKKTAIKENPEHLRWVHRMVGNAKTGIMGTYHGLGPKHVQRYLNEFCFRTNRRWFGGQLFNRLLNACMSTTTITYKALINPVLT